MMMVNGSTDLKTAIWSQAISVLPNTNYDFSAWIISLSDSPNNTRLQFAINGVKMGDTIKAGSDWNKFSTTWYSGNETTATVSMLKINVPDGGGDFALDDISFSDVATGVDSFTVNVTGYCGSINISGPNRVCSKTDVLTYSISRAQNCTRQFSLVVDNAFADVVSQTDNSINLIFKKEGVTQVKVAFDNECKTVTDSIPVTVKFSPTAINLIPDISTCRDTLIKLEAAAGFDSYVWQDGSVKSTYAVTTAGNYFVQAQNFCGTLFRDSFHLIKTTPLPFNAYPLNATVCKGDSVQFNASGGNVYSWQPAGNFNNPGMATPKAVINESRDFTVQISDVQCGRDTLLLIPVTAKERAEITVTKRNDVNCRLDSTILIASGGITYSWAPGMYISRASGNQITVKPPQTMTYYLLGTDAGGCVGQDSVTVFFTKEGEQELFVPNAFTPNNDGLNDVFKPVFTGPATKFDFQIFNRWGQQVFHSNTPGKGWNGMFKSRLQPGDVYVYFITVEGGCNGRFEKKGTFVLIK